MFALAKEINIYYHAVTVEGIPCNQEHVMIASNIYAEMAEILGILTDKANSGKRGSADLTEKLMNIIIGLRQQARQSKDWATADKIRDELKAAGITLEDSSTGVRWKK